VAAETVSKGFGLGRPGLRGSLGVVWSVFRARIKIITRYKGAVLLESIIPVIFAGLPILLGSAVAGSESLAAKNFSTYTNLDPAHPFTAEDFRLYMMMGSNTFMVVSLMLWLIGYWVRREQETGTLEALYLAPASAVEGGLTLSALLTYRWGWASALYLGLEDDRPGQQQLFFKLQVARP